jgi:hypothetical protein
MPRARFGCSTTVCRARRAGISNERRIRISLTLLLSRFPDLPATARLLWRDFLLKRAPKRPSVTSAFHYLHLAHAGLMSNLSRAMYERASLRLSAALCCTAYVAFKQKRTRVRTAAALNTIRRNVHSSAVVRRYVFHSLGPSETSCDVRVESEVRAKADIRLR